MNRSTRRKRSHPGRSGTAPTAAPSSPGPGGFNVSAGIFLCPVPNFAGVLRARAGCGDAGEGGCRPERGGGGGPRGPAAPTTPLNERFALKNTRATFRKRGWGCPPASQSGRPLLPPPGTPAGTGRVGECGGLCSFYRTPPPPPPQSFGRRSEHGGGGGAGPAGGGRLPWCHTSGCPWKYDPMPWPTKKGQTWKPPRCATELRGQRGHREGACPNNHHLR